MTQPAEMRARTSQWQRYLAYGALIAILLFFAFVRVRLRHLPLERDEGEYAYAGQLMLQGVPPYKLAYNMKLPGTYAAYAVIMAVFGETEGGIRLGLLLVNSASILLVFLLARRLQGLLAGVIAAATFGLLSTRMSVLGLYGHATHFVTLAALAGIVLLLQAIEKQRRGILFCSGVCMGFAFLMKQPGILFGIFAGMYWLWMNRDRRISELASGSAVFSAGVILPFALTCLILYDDGVFRDFWFWTFSYARAYGSMMSVADGWRELRKILPWVVRPLAVWMIAGVGLTAIFWDRKVCEKAVFLLGFLFFSMAAVVPGFYFRPHYFIVLLPVVAIWAGIAVAAAQRKLKGSLSRPWLAVIPIVIFAAGFAISPHRHLGFFFQLHATGANQQLDNRTGFAEAKEVAGYIEAHSTRQDRLAVFGSEPEIYFYSHRHSATGYIYSYALLEKQDFASQMRNQMMAEVERAAPKYAVLVDNEPSWDWGIHPLAQSEVLKPVEEFLRMHYRLEKQVVIPGNADHRWGSQPSFYVFRRKDT